MKTTAEMIREYFAAPADVKEFLAQNYGDVLPIETSAPKKPRKLFNNDFAKMAKVEENLENVLNRFSSFLSDLYIKTEGENDFAVNTHGKFVNLWDLCVQEGGGVFETVTNWCYPEELFWGIKDEQGNSQLPATKVASLGSETPNCLDTADLLKIVSNSK